MATLLSHSRGRRKEGRSQRHQAQTEPVFRAKTEEILRNELPRAGDIPQPGLKETISAQQPVNEEAFTQPHLVDEWAHLPPDGRGAELAREARVWRVYVGETDKWDKERVEGWDKSMDVLLVFAALFSAISGAFLIETSKLLKEDPADVSAAALRVIAQVLVTTTTNNSTMDPPTLPPPEESFIPPKVAVIINTLWYISLSLSIATAFLAMLAKDWCYSFLAHRTGHSRDQAHRRQRKWKLIERWKMEELIIALPLLMHLSLLLFAVGLCIYLWDLNSTIAIPVMCIAGAFLAFYIWSSIAASIVDDFPYTTVIARVLRSNYLKVPRMIIGLLVTLVYVLMVLVWVVILLFHSFLVIILALTLYLVAIVLVPSAFGLLVPVYLFGCTTNTAPIQYLAGVGSQLPDLINSTAWKVISLPVTLPKRLAFYFDEVKKRLELSDELITSSALSWLIKHCETPSAVDIALQAIAGASQRVPKEPLLASHATEQIMRRIVAHGVHDDGQSRNRLYIRALATLGLNSNTTPSGKKGDITEDVGVMIWDLKSRNESIVANFIKHGSFVPSDHNLEAMRIGNSAPSQCLDIFMGGSTTTSQTLYSIQRLLSGHLECKGKELHPAALQTLADAAAFFSSVSISAESPPGLVDAFMHYCDLCISAAEGPPGSVPALTSFILCVLLHGNTGRGGAESPQATQTLDQLHTRAWHSIRTLTDISAEGESFRNLLFWIGASEILSNPSEYGLKQGDNGWKSLHGWCAGRASQFMRDCWQASVSAAVLDDHAHVDPNEFLSITIQVYELIEVSRPDDSGPTRLSESLHTILMLIACGNTQDEQQKFVTSLELRTYKNDKNVLSQIRKTYTTNKHSQKHFATTQIWLLLHLIDDASSELQKRLQTNIEQELEACLQLQNKGFNQVRLELEALIIDGYRKTHRINPKAAHGKRGSLPTRNKPKAPRLKWFTGINTQSSSTHADHGLNEVTGTLATKIEKHHLLDKHQRIYTARIIALILEIRGIEGNGDLLPLIAGDFKELPPSLQTFSPNLEPVLAPLFASLPPSLAASRVSIQTVTTLMPHTITEPPVADTGHVTVEIPGSPNPSNSEDHDSDLGLTTLFNDASHV